MTKNFKKDTFRRLRLPADACFFYRLSWKEGMNAFCRSEEFDASREV